MWEEELLENLMELIGHVKLSLNNDSWVCDMGAEEGYSVKDGYHFLSKNFLPEVVQNESVRRVLKMVWESFAPMKIMIFSWQSMLHRLPTRVNLFRRGVITASSLACYVWCGGEMESESHLFTTCTVAVDVWRAVYSWLGVCTVVPGNIFQSFESFGYPFKCKKRAKGLILIWQTVIWCLWKARNSIIFEGKVQRIYDIVEAIKRRSLEWFTARKFAGVCMLYEWEKAPLLCLLR
jgi:hypothetical protein